MSFVSQSTVMVVVHSCSSYINIKVYFPLFYIQVASTQHRACRPPAWAHWALAAAGALLTSCSPATSDVDLKLERGNTVYHHLSSSQVESLKWLVSWSDWTVRGTGGPWKRVNCFVNIPLFSFFRSRKWSVETQRLLYTLNKNLNAIDLIYKLCMSEGVGWFRCYCLLIMMIKMDA